MKSFTFTIAALMSVSALGGQAGPTPVQAAVTPLVTLPAGDDEFAGGPVGSAGGRLIFYGTNTEVKVFDRSTGKTVLVAKGMYEQFAVSPAGDWLAMVRGAEGAKPGPSRATYLWSIPVNPRTGVATGEARRASILAASSPAFSPDGKWIAFVATGTLAKLVVIPAAGGTERVLVDRGVQVGAPLGALQWDREGKWIYFYQAGGLSRVSFDGGTPIGVATEGSSVMLAPDGEHLVSASHFSSRGVSISILDAKKNVVGRTAVAFDSTLGIPCAFGWSGKGMHMLAAMFSAKMSLHAQAVPSGADRAIPGVTVSGNATMSPDGKRIALATMTDSTHNLHLVIMNADGTDRRIGQQLEPTNWHQLDWSPDGKYVAYRMDNRRTLNLVEVATLKVTKVGSADFQVQDLRWHPDSRSLLYVRVDGTVTRSRVAVWQTSVEGQDRLVRDLSSELPPEGEKYYAVSWFLGDSALLNIRLGLVMRIAGGPTEKLYDPIKITTDGTAPAVSADGRWVAIPSADGKAFQLLSSDGKVHRTLALPASATLDNKEAAFHPDNRTLVAEVKAGPTTPAAIYLIPIDGSAPRAVVTASPGESIDAFVVSTDGKSILYGRTGRLSITLVEADLGAGLAGKSPAKQ